MVNQTGDRCTLCCLSRLDSNLPFRRNVEDTGNNLCGECSIEYSIFWRPEYSPDEPNVAQFIYEIKQGQYTPRQKGIAERRSRLS
jgi:hypothetical protein